MRFLANESCDFAVIRALRDAGFDVLAVSDVAPGAEDHIVIDRAVREERMLIAVPEARKTPRPVGDVLRTHS